MATIKEDYVSFYIAKLLKQKEFDELCIFKYNYEGIRMKAGIAIDEWQNSELDDNEYSCPTLQMAMKWLRDVHNIHIELNPICYGDTEEDIEWHYGWAVKTTIFIDRWKRHNAEHISYEQAAETAIKYCLENLI